MQGRAVSFALALVTLIALASSARSMSPNLLGGKSARAVDDHAAQLAHFAVGEIASKANAPGLSLARVTGLSTQVVAGVKYYFELEARDAAGATRRFEAQVWEKPGGYANEAPELTGYKEVAAEGAADCANPAPMAAGDAGGWAAAAARHAVEAINARSNSLVPYALEAIEVAERDAAGATGAGAARLVLALKRGDKRERFEARVEDRGSGAFALKSFAPAPPG